MPESIRVLIVADSAERAAAGAERVRSTDSWPDATITVALSHDEALRALEQAAVDAALFAHPLGVRDALRLRRDIRERGGEPPLIVLADASPDALRLDEERRRSHKMEAVGRLAGGVAHDFNNLLTAILGYCNLMLDDVAEEDPLRHDLEEIRKAGERAASLTHQLLAFSRRQMLQPQVLSVNVLIERFVKMLRRLLGDGIALTTTLAVDLRTVNVDPASFEQVFVHLAANARDAMPEGGTLTIETANVRLEAGDGGDLAIVVPGPYVMIAVRDTGTGIDAQSRAHIFEPFFTTKAQGKGEGLGLATVYGIVKQSNGYIWVYSEPGQGATFNIYLPAVEVEGG